VHTEEKLDEIGSRLKHTTRKLLTRLTHENEASKSCGRRATQLLKLRPYKTTVTQVTQPRHPASRVHFCSWFLQSVDERDIDQ
jgi:hypothetical protein